MGARPNPDCFTCGKAIQPEDRRVIVNVTRGGCSEIPDNEYNSIFHESCYLQSGEPKTELPRLTQEQIQDYPKYAGVHCPYCGESDIESGSFDGEGFFQRVACHKCGREWRDIYSLVDIEEIMS